MPPGWVNVTGSALAVTTLDGQKVLQKAPLDTIFKRARVFIGPTTWSNYTFEADVRAAERRRQMGDVGITAQRYSLVLYGNSQRLKLEPWEPETTRTVDGAVRVEAGHLVSAEAARREPAERPGARARQGVAGGRARAGGVDDRQDRSDRQPAGRAGLFIDAQFGAYLDNFVSDARISRDLMRIHLRLFASRPHRCRSPSRGVSPDRRATSDPGTGDWPMWGGTPDRNMVSTMKGLPAEWDVKTKKNVKWVADLGSQSYGNPVVAGGMVFVGTNNELLRDPKQGGDRGVLMAFRESDGEFLWQQTHVKLEAGRANDWPFQGVASSPLVEGEQLYYVSNRGVVLCLDIQGFRDNENDGPVKDEKLTGQIDADVIWSFDMMEEVGAYPHNLANSSPVVWGDLIFVSTSNGQDESHVNIPSPRAPSIIAINKNTGKLVWEDNSVEDRILHGQWSTPSVGTHRRRRCRSSRRRATAGSAATRRRPARSSGSSTPTRRTRSGRARATS